MNQTPVKLSDVLRVKHGYAFSGSEFTDDQRYPTLVTPGNIALGGGFQTSKPKTFRGQVQSEFILRPGDLIVTMTDLSKAGDTLGLPALIPNDGVTYLHNQRIGLVEITCPDRVDKSYLRYFLRTEQYRAHILGTASGSTVRHTSPSRIGSFQTELPKIDEQRTIARVLGTLDDKIAANTKLTRTADDLATVSFQAMLAESSSKPLSETARFINGRAFTRGATGTGRVVIRIAELNSGIGGSTVFNDIDVPDEHLARPGDLLFAWSGSLTLHRWFRPEAIVNQHIFKVVPNDGYPLWLVNQLLQAKLADFKAIASDKATTMGHIQRRHLDEPVQVPDPATIRRNDEYMRNLWLLALSAEQESLKLAETRDTLLPLLMSGRLRVKDAEAVVESAL